MYVIFTQRISEENGAVFGDIHIRVSDTNANLKPNEYALDLNNLDIDFGEDDEIVIYTGIKLTPGE